MKTKLTESEMKYINKLIKNSEKLYLNYIVTGIVFCLSLVGLIFGIQFHNKSGFIMAIYFGTMAAMLLLKTRFDSKVVNIIKKFLENEKEPGRP